MKKLKTFKKKGTMYRYLQARSKIIQVRLDAEVLKIQHVFVTFTFVNSKSSKDKTTKSKTPHLFPHSGVALLFLFFFFALCKNVYSS